jgi:DNA-binding XRE family transcriptional regulator
VVLTRAEYESLVRAAEEAEEEAADIAAYDAAKAEAAGSDRLPFKVSQLMLKGATLLKALRLWRDETQLHLAFKTGTSQGFISDLENGRRNMTDDVAQRLAEVLDVPRHWLTR